MHKPRVERRKQPRIPMQVPITVWNGGGVPEIIGTTRDVSLKGVFFFVAAWPVKGRAFQFMLTLPSLPSRQMPDFCDGRVISSHEFRVFCQGKVVRVETSGSPRHFGVAAIIERYRVSGL